MRTISHTRYLQKYVSCTGKKFGDSDDAVPRKEDHDSLVRQIESQSQPEDQKSKGKEQTKDKSREETKATETQKEDSKTEASLWGAVWMLFFMFVAIDVYDGMKSRR